MTSLSVNVTDVFLGLLQSTGYSIEVGERLTLVSKAGMDGSGSHRARHQRVDKAKSLEENPHLDPDAYKNYLLTCLCPLELKSAKEDGTETVIWKNSSPNGMSYTRPLSLIRAAESREVIEDEFSGLLQEIDKTKV